MQKKIIIDTNVYIEIFNAGANEGLNKPFQYIVFLAYPVLHELWMGAAGKKEIRYLSSFQDRFARLKRLIVPSETSLIMLGEICHCLRSTGKLDPVYPKHYNDITIAILGRQIGATIISKNVKIFRTIQKVLDFDFEKP